MLPPDWAERVRRLPEHTLPHVPAAFRTEHAEAMAAELEEEEIGDDERDYSLIKKVQDPEQ